MAVHGCPSAHTGRLWLSVCVRVCPSEDTGRLWLSISTHISTLFLGSVWTSPGRLLGEPMVRVQDGSTKWVLGLGQGVGKLPECELRLSDRFVKGRKGEKPPMGGYGTVLGRRDVIW